MQPEQFKGPSESIQVPRQTEISKNKRIGKLLGIIILILLSVGGVSFGICSAIVGQNEKQAFETQIAVLEEEKASLVADLENTQISSEYLYIPEWGIKIKMPEELVGNVSYLFNGNELNVIDKSGLELGVSTADMIGDDNAILSVVRNLVGEVDFENCLTGCAEYITTIDGYDYSGMLSANNTQVFETTLLKDLLNGENYSEI